jgi:gliding motility-associated-like protein
MTKWLKIGLVSAAFLTAINSSAQLVTSTSMSPTDLVEDVLVGSGVAVSGVTYTGSPEAIGYFDGSSTNLGLNEGILLTTGTVLNTSSGGLFSEPQGPHGPNNSGGAGLDNEYPGYGPLTALAGSDTYNAAVLEFDFVPQNDTVSFRYVFASEEYPEFVDGGFNDAFAFFISGPGFAGDYNMAQIPGGGGIVSIDNVNNGPTNSGPCQNCAYYVENGDGDDSPEMDSDYYIQYDGFTVVITALAEVTCGETYHLKIAIADAGDGSYDSGIFLEANSLDAIPSFDIDADLDLNGFDDGTTAAEGCETATFTISRSDISEEVILPINAAGTATEGVDYEALPPSVTFPAGVATVSFDIEIYSDLLTEGLESLIVQVTAPDPCGDSDVLSTTINIQDVNPLTVTVADADVYCPLDDAVLTAVVSGGLPDYTYDWDNGETTPSITVNPAVTTDYSVTVNDICIGIPVTVSATVNVPDYPPLVINTTPDITVLCPNTPNVLAVEVSGGEGTYSYQWTNEAGTTVSVGPTANVSPMVTTTYTVVVTDGCGSTIEGEVTVTVTATVLELEMSPDQLICPGDTAEIWVIATEGLGDYTYYWLETGETTSNINVSPSYTTTYTVSVEDACHTYDIKGSTTVEVVRPNASFNVLTEKPMENLPVSFFNISEGDVAWWWDFGNGDFSDLHSPLTTYDSEGWYDVTLVAFNEIGCTDTATKQIYIKPEFYFYAPNAFTPDNSRFNNTYKVSVIGSTDFLFQIFNRWGDLIYETTNPDFRWDGSIDGHLVSDDVVVWKARITDMEEIPHEFTGTIAILR